MPHHLDTEQLPEHRDDADDVGRSVVIAVDAEERTLDALALGRLLAHALGVPAVLTAIFPYTPLEDTSSPEMVVLLEEGRAALGELGAAEGLAGAEVRVIPGNFSARELQRISEQPGTGLVVVGSTTRGPIGRLLLGGVGERLLAGAACPVAFAPRGYGERSPERLRSVAVGFDGSAESHRALDAAIAIARASHARIRVLTAFERVAFGGVSTSGLSGESANDVMRSELRTRHDAALAQAAESVPAEGRFRDGHAGEVLEEDSRDVDLLVAGSRGYGPLGAVLAGSATAILAKRSTCPLLVLPRGAHFDLLA